MKDLLIAAHAVVSAWDSRFEELKSGDFIRLEMLDKAVEAMKQALGAREPVDISDLEILNSDEREEIWQSGYDACLKDKGDTTVI